MQRATIATGQNLPLGVSRVIQRLLGEHGDKGIKRGVERVDASQNAFRHIDR
jgi:hypothetical protein